jgi:ArsR family transcriptional regulator
MKELNRTVTVSSAARDSRLAELAQALGHPARVAIVRLLHAKKACICGEIVDELPLAQSTVSQHLKILKDAGWIQGEVDGPRVCYCIDPRTAARFTALMENLTGGKKHDIERTGDAACCQPRQKVSAQTARRPKRARLVSRD